MTMTINDLLKQGHHAKLELNSIVPLVPEAMRQHLSEAVAKGAAIESFRHPSSFMLKAVGDYKDRTVEGYESTRMVDFDGDILMPSGCDLSLYMMNPVVMVGHNYSKPPIGKCLAGKADDFGVRVSLEFAKTDTANEYWTLIKDGFVRALSVGAMSEPGKNLHRDMESTRASFISRIAELKSKWPELTEEMARRCSRIVESWKQIELSVVNVPNNPYAMLDAIKKGVLELSTETKAAFDITEAEHEPIIIRGVTATDIRPVVSVYAVAPVSPDAIKEAVAAAVTSGIEKELAKRRGKL